MNFSAVRHHCCIALCSAIIREDFVADTFGLVKNEGRNELNESRQSRMWTGEMSAKTEIIRRNPTSFYWRWKRVTYIALLKQAIVTITCLYSRHWIVGIRQSIESRERTQCQNITMPITSSPRPTVAMKMNTFITTIEKDRVAVTIYRQSQFYNNLWKQESMNTRYKIWNVNITYPFSHYWTIILSRKSIKTQRWTTALFVRNVLNAFLSKS